MTQTARPESERQNPEITAPRPVLVTLAPIMVIVLVSFLIIGMAIPVLPLYVHHGLDLSTFMVGLATGIEFGAALLSRFWSGRYADTRGAQRAVVVGSVLGIVAGLLYLLSNYFAQTPGTAITVLLLGRFVLGGAESFVITGALAWGLSVGRSRNTGKVISWIGTALWGAFAVGAPAGSILYDHFGFLAIALATTILPLTTLLLAARLRPVAPTANTSPSTLHMLGTIWLPGMGLALSAVGFGAIITFGALLFAQRGWSSAWIAFSTMGIAFILGRIAFGHLPDRFGGARVSLVCILIEAAGIALIWFAPSPTMAITGAFVVGMGYSLVYPGFGVEVIQLAPLGSRGLAMGAYSAFLDLSLGIANPALGLLADRAGLGPVFLTSIVIVLLSIAIAVQLLRARS